MPSKEMALFRRPGVLAVLAIGLICVVGGCDLTGEEGDLSLLLGSWVAQDLAVDGISVKAQLDAQYDRLVLTLREGANGGEFFTIIGREEGTKEDLFVRGTFDLDGKELTLFPEKGPQIEFDRAVTDSSGTRLTLSTEEGASEDLFLELIQLPIQGAVDRLELRLSKGRTSADVSLGNPPGQLTPFRRPSSLAGTVQPTLTLGTRPSRRWRAPRLGWPWSRSLALSTPSRKGPMDAVGRTRESGLGLAVTKRAVESVAPRFC